MERKGLLIVSVGLMLVSLLALIGFFVLSPMSHSNAAYNKAKAQYYIKQGNAYFHDGLYAKAIQEYENSLKFVHQIDVYRWLGHAYYKIGDSKNAEIQYQKFIDMAQGSKEAMRASPGGVLATNTLSTYVYLAHSYSQERNYDKVIALCNEGLGINPNHVLLLNNLADAYMNKGLYSEAIAAIEKALAIDQNLAIVHSTYGEIYEKMGDYTKALGEFEKIKNDPEFRNYANTKISKMNEFIKNKP